MIIKSLQLRWTMKNGCVMAGKWVTAVPLSATSTMVCPLLQMKKKTGQTAAIHVSTLSGCTRTMITV